MLLRQRLDLGPNIVRGTAMQMIVAGIFLALLSPLMDDYSTFSWSTITTRSTYAWLFLVFFGSIVAFSAF